MSTVIYLDACPKCPPGIPEASPSLGAPALIPGGTVTDHQCSSCAVAWSAFWKDGWVVERLLAPVSPDQASPNRGVLGEAVKGAARERAA